MNLWTSMEFIREKIYLYKNSFFHKHISKSFCGHLSLMRLFIMMDLRINVCLCIFIYLFIFSYITWQIISDRLKITHTDLHKHCFFYRCDRPLT